MNYPTHVKLNCLCTYKRKPKVTNPLKSRCIRLGRWTGPLIALELFRYAMHRIVLVNLRASRRDAGKPVVEPTTLVRQEGIPRLRRTLDALILHSWFPSRAVELLRPVHKQAPYPKARPWQRLRPRKHCCGTRASWPQENLGRISLVYQAEVAGLVSYTSAVSSGK